MTEQNTRQKPNGTPPTSEQVENTRPRRSPNLKDFAKPAISIVILGLVLFLAAGDAGWVAGWVYFSLIVVNNFAVSMMMDPELLAERAKVGQGVKRWDIPLAIIMGRLGPVATLLVAGLDRRFGWSPAVPLWAVTAAFFVLLAGLAISDWAVVVNPFFSGVVRIQHDRGHHVITFGPYRWVRHPGYLGSILYILSTPLVLSSWWALVPGGLAAAAAVIRTALEDRTLRKELSGYNDYARQVPYRLLPGVW